MNVVATRTGTRRRLLLGAAALVLLAILLRVLFAPTRGIEVEVATASIGPVEDVVVNSEAGTIMSRSRSLLGVEAIGRVAEIPRREGSAVKTGDLLLRLESTTEKTRLLAARRAEDVQRATLLSARSAADLARRTDERVTSLHGRGLASQAQLDEARAGRRSAEADARAAEARLRNAEAAVRLAQDDLSHVEIRAPYDGTIAHRRVEVGEQVSPGQPLLELVSLGRLYVSAPIDERDAGRLEVGLPVRVTVDTYPGVVWASRLTRIAPVIETAEEQNRTQEIEADFPPDSTRPRPRPGMTADVEIVLARRPRVLRVPTFAVMDGRRVFAVERGRAVSRAVTVGLKSWEWSEIRSGLREGERVVTTLDRAGLEEGARLIPRASTSAAPSGP